MQANVQLLVMEYHFITNYYYHSSAYPTRDGERHV